MLLIAYPHLLSRGALVLYQNGIQLNHTQIDNYYQIYSYTNHLMFTILKLLYAVFNYTNPCYPIIITDINYAALKSRHLSSYIQTEDIIARGDMVKCSWSKHNYCIPHADN